ncbi:MAG: ATP-binding cassette domain-containing protein [Methylobacillus sp.]|jgi:cell division transport system ATP-binding protein|nr:ATP-binding cassette domain-containing protein [Methylobacillus sp.]
MIKFDRVGKLYPGGHEALNNLSFEIAQGELVFVTGHSGAGKSTLLKLIAGLERATSGTVLIGHQNISQLRRAALPFLRRKFGMVFQDHKLLYDRNVFDNVALPLHINGVVGQEAAKRVRAALDKVGLLGRERAMPVTLSGGEQQRLAIARAVVSRPEILIADEPMANLDDSYATDLMRLFRSFHQVGVTVLIATHARGGEQSGSDRVLHLTQGKLA